MKRKLSLDLYTVHRDALVNYAGRLSGDWAGAEDIVQDAWLLFDRQPDPGLIQDPLGYLRRIVRNLVFDQGRRRRRERTILAPVIADGMEGIADDQPTADIQCADRQAIGIVLDTIDAMPENQGAAIRMYHFEGLKLREVAERLGLSVSHVHGLIVAGMAECNRRRKMGC